MEPQPKSRRKRKDPQSRDFICKCGKSYLSYAAAYTHVKNKHDAQKQFLQNIEKPQREKLKRGRPKQRKQLTSSIQTQALSIIEEAILKIYQQLKAGSDSVGKIVLQGNQEVTQQALRDEYDSFCELKKAQCKLDFDMFKKQLQEKHPELNLVLQFETKINKHFSASIAAKIRWFLNLIVVKRILKKKSNEKLRQQKQDKDIVDTVQIFEGADGINQIIVNALKKWSDAIEKAKQSEEEYSK